MTAPSDTATPNARRNLALANAELADGALTLVPPAGFCVDKSTLRPSFAVVARCDSLGARQTVNDAPLGMIVVSVARPPSSQIDLGAVLDAIVTQEAEVLESREDETVALVHLRGPAPEGADSRYWRGLARIGPFLLGLTAYAPRGGRLSGAAGERLLSQMIRRTAEATGSDQ